jgi:TRAP-type transport system periplasmic protein
VHAARGRDEEGATALHEALAIGEGVCPSHAAAASRELGYVEFLRGRYERSLVLLHQAGSLAGEDLAEQTRIAIVHGSVLSDTAHYGESIDMLRQAIRQAEALGDKKQQAYALSMLGRALLLNGNLSQATLMLDASIALAQQLWTAFLPWPQSLRAEVDMVNGNVDAAGERFEHAFGVEFFNQASVVLSTLVPAAGILNTGFAFHDYNEVWKAMDGPLGTYVRAQIEKVGLLTMSKPWDNGFRNVTTSTKPIKTPDDLKGLKMRVPAAPMLSSLFTSLGASPTPINFNELYSALQTKLVEGQENPLAIISTARLYEVQKYCSLTNHVWDAYWILGNRKAMERLPKDIQEIVYRELEKSATDERADIAGLNSSLRTDLASKGIQMIDPDKKAFKDLLAKNGFYKDLRAKFGEEAWKLLSDSVGGLG